MCVCVCVCVCVQGYGRNPGLVFGAICGILAMALTYLGSEDMQTYCNANHGHPRPCSSFSRYGYFYTAAVLYAFLDCTIQSVSGAICAKSFAATGNTADAWALFRTFQAVGAAFCFFISPALVASGETYSTSEQLLVEIAINTITGVAALFGHWLFTRYAVGNAMDPNDPAPFDHSSQAVVVDRTVYTSAIGSGSEAKLDGLTSADEMGLACDEVIKVLESAGSGADKAVKVTIFTTPDADVNAVVAIYKERFTGPDCIPQPVLSLAMVAQLPFGRRIQIDVVGTV